MVISLNPITKKSHEIPGVLDDSENIIDFLKKNKGKKVVVVQVLVLLVLSCLWSVPTLLLKNML